MDILNISWENLKIISVIHVFASIFLCIFYIIPFVNKHAYKYIVIKRVNSIIGWVLGFILLIIIKHKYLFFGAAVIKHTEYVFKTRMHCPHCTNPMNVRSSRQQHPLLKIVYFQCQNVECSFSCQANLQIMNQISPPALANPDINIPSVKIIRPQKVKHG